MTVKENLEKQGWFLSPLWLSENLEDTEKELISKALKLDLRKIGDKCLPDDIFKNNASRICGPKVLQIQKVRNVATPKALEESGNTHGSVLYRANVTDGHIYCNVLQNGPWKKLNSTTNMGAKILIPPNVSLTMKHNFILMKESDYQFLGGSLEASVIEKKENKKYNERKPPAWVSFGTSVNMGILNVKKGFKALDAPSENERPNESEEFIRDRFAKVQEAKPMDKNFAEFSELHRPEKVYTKPKNVKKDPTKIGQDPRADGDSNFRGRGGRHKGRRGEKDPDAPELRPSKPSTLFDFMSNHIKDGDNKKPESSSKGDSSTSNFADQKDNSQSKDLSFNKKLDSLSLKSEHIDWSECLPDECFQSPTSYRPDEMNFNNRGSTVNRGFINKKPEEKKNSNWENNHGNVNKKPEERKFSNRENSDNNRYMNRKPEERNFSNREGTDPHSHLSNKPDVRNFSNWESSDNYGNRSRKPEERKFQNRDSSSNTHGNTNRKPEERNFSNRESTDPHRHLNRKPEERNFSNWESTDNYGNKSRKPEERKFQNRDSSSNTHGNTNRKHEDRNFSNWENPSSHGQVNRKPEDMYSSHRDKTSNRGSSSYNDSSSLRPQNYERSEESQDFRKYHQNPNSQQNKKPTQSYYSSNTKNKPQNQPHRDQSKETVKPFCPFQIGDTVLAQYWEDKKFYEAVIDNISIDTTTCLVRFSDYGNIEEVPTSDMKPLSSTNTRQEHPRPDYSKATKFKTLEFRRRD